MSISRCRRIGCQSRRAWSGSWTFCGSAASSSEQLSFPRKEPDMTRTVMARAMLTGMVVGAFTLGYVTGSVSQRRADAQGLGGILDQAGKAGGLMGTAKELGTSITEMQDHVTGLQKNLETLKKLQSAL